MRARSHLPCACGDRGVHAGTFIGSARTSSIRENYRTPLETRRMVMRRKMTAGRMRAVERGALVRARNPRVDLAQRAKD